PYYPSNRDTPPSQPLPAPMNLPPSNRPGAGSVPSQPLSPPAGGDVAAGTASAAARRDCGAGPAVGSAPATGCVDALPAARGAAARSRVATQCSATGKYIAAAQ